MMASRALVTRMDATAKAAQQQQQEPVLHPSLEQGKAYLDALPYVDGQLDPVARATADRLVLEEMQNPRFPRKDYLADRPMPEVNFERSVFIKHELERIAAGRPMEPLDETRYACNKPAPKLQGDLQAWRAALNNLRAQQEHQGNRLVNMELLQTYAPDVWLLYNEELERFKCELDKELEGLRKEADMVNLARKTKQDEAAPRLYNLTRKRDETLYQNLELQKACAMLRQEVKRLRVEAEDKGVLGGEEGGEAGSDED